jgi:cell division septum initiation protein DivIVA
MAHVGLKEVLLSYHREKKYLAAICAAPSVLGMNGLLTGRHATCYPGFEEKLSGARAEADSILKKATDNATYRGEQIVAGAKEQADSIIRIAKSEAELEKKKAEDGIKREIVEISGALTEKMLGREIKTEDHKALIDAFIEDIGDGND